MPHRDRGVLRRPPPGGWLDPAFGALWDPTVFAGVRVDAELRTPSWANSADLAPDVLHDAGWIDQVTVMQRAAA